MGSGIITDTQSRLVIGNCTCYVVLLGLFFYGTIDQRRRLGLFDLLDELRIGRLSWIKCSSFFLLSHGIIEVFFSLIASTKAVVVAGLVGEGFDCFLIFSDSFVVFLVVLQGYGIVKGL